MNEKLERKWNAKCIKRGFFQESLINFEKMAKNRKLDKCALESRNTSSFLDHFPTGFLRLRPRHLKIRFIQKKHFIINYVS